MPNKITKFFEFAKYDSIYEDVQNIVDSSLDGLNILKIDDPNEPWGPCALIEQDYHDVFLLRKNLDGVYAIDPPNLNNRDNHIIKITIRLDKYTIRDEIKPAGPTRTIKNRDMDGSIEELEDRLKGEGYDWDLRKLTDNVYKYTIYLGKWSHTKDEWGVSYNKFISENVRQSGDGSYSNFEGKDGQIMDLFHDLSDEFGLVYFPVPNKMNDSNKYLEEQSSNGCWYLSPNTNQINIKIAFKESYIKENIREFVYYMEELENRLMDFTWESICDNRSFGANHVYKLTHHIKKIVNNYRFTDEEIIDLEENKNIIPRIFHINCFVAVCGTEEIEKSLFQSWRKKI